MMGKVLGSDIASGFFSRGSFDLRKEGFTGKMISVSSEVFTKGLRHIKLKLAFLCNTKFLQDYDTVIFSGDSISAVRNCPPSPAKDGTSNSSPTEERGKVCQKIYYCHTPPRYLYDLKELYLKKVPFLIRPIFLLVSWIFKRAYESDISQMDLVLTNSKNTQKRIKDFL
ncbi:MAG: hypothetical protein H6767_03500 [Candidatus Peribacteria bacterium]|nr:MAG: hypothetical protein H6767_03500 [Candidatus Peribacteria bacterium]